MPNSHHFPDRRNFFAVFPLCLFLLAALPGAVHADATDTVCAKVEIEIEQELTLERQAFDARLRVVNGLESVDLEDFTVDVLFEDANGNAVEGTSNPDDEDAAFFIRVDELTNVDSVDGGTIPGGADATMEWLIVPSPGAADADPNGTLYFVGAELSYTYGGEEEEISVTPDSIRVKPMPALTLDYFLPRDVHANDPLTDEIEPAIPFTLGVRVANTGDGEARSLAIESAQPEIVNNELDLPIEFRIIDSQVGNEPREPNLNIDFGTIEQGEARSGRWRMETTFSGRFTEFDATYTHADEFGGALTSLLEDVRAHELVGDVLVDLPGRDNVRDFLAFDADYGDLRVYESSGLDSSVTDHSDEATLEEQGVGPDGGIVEVEIPETDGFAYARLNDPYDQAFQVNAVIREDGKRLPTANVWIETEYLAGGDRESWLHLFDVNTPGTYQVELGTRSVDPGDPVIQFIPDQKTYEGGQLGFQVTAGDAAGNEPALQLEGPGRGEAFNDNDDGTGTFLWSPEAGDAGTYVLTFHAEHSGRTGRRDVAVQVNPAHDTDGDGMDDDWEMEHFGHLDRDGTGDYSGDGISDRMAFERGLDPTVKHTVDEFRAVLGTSIIDDDWREVEYLREFAAPVVIAGPASLNDTEAGTVAVDARDDEAFSVRFARWPHLEAGHGVETVSWLVAEPGNYFVDVDDDDITIEVGTFELDAAGTWSEQEFMGGFPGTPLVLTTIQRDGEPEELLAPRVDNVTSEGFTAAVFAEEAGGGGEADVTVGYIAIHDDDGSGTLPLVDEDVDYERFERSIGGDGVEVAEVPLRLQSDGSVGGDSTYSQAEPVGGIHTPWHLLAQPQSAGRDAAVTLRSGVAGGEGDRFNFARPSRIVPADDGEVEVEIVRSGQLEEAAVIELSTESGTAVAGRDFEEIDGEEITFEPGEALQRRTIALEADGNERPSQAFEVQLDSLDSATEVGSPGSVLVTVVDGPVADSNHSGMADFWEEHYFGEVGAEPGSGDYDGDGINNRRSFLEGIDPTAGEPQPEWLVWRPEVVVDDVWSDVELDGVSDEAVVISGIASEYDDQPGVARFRRNEDDASWEARFARFEDGEGLETVPVLAIEPGRHELGLDTWEAGRSSLADDAWQTVEFADSFSHTPRLLATPQSGDDAQVMAIGTIDTDGFEARVLGADGAPVEGEIGWVAFGGAVASGRLDLDEESLEYRLEQQPLDDHWQELAAATIRLQAHDAATLGVEMVDLFALDGHYFGQPVLGRTEDLALMLRRSVLHDGDHDGLPDRWELGRGLDPTDPDDALIDLDGDGFSALAEYIAGTDPRDALDTPVSPGVRLHTPLISAWPTPLDFGREYEDPVVIAGAATDYDPDPGVVRIEHVDGTGAHAWFQEWDYLDGLHGRERVPFLSLEAGRHLIDDQQVWEAGRIQVDDGAQWVEVTFDAPHDSVPKVMVTPQSADGSPVVARVRDVTESGFSVALFPEGAGEADAVSATDVGYLAASPVDRSGADTTGYVDSDEVSHRFRLEQAEVDEEETHVGRQRLRMQSEQSSGNSYPRDPETVDILRFDDALFAQDTSYHDSRPGSLRLVTTASDDEIRLSEAFLILQGLDPDDDELAERDYSGDGFSVLEEYVALTDIFNPDDSPVRPQIRRQGARAGDTWTPVDFANRYRDPVVIAGAASAHDPTPGVVQLDEVSGEGLQVRFANWAYVDHVREDREDIPLLALDAGRHLVDGNQIWEAATDEVEAPGEWTQVHFRRAHNEVPHVLTTVQTTNSSAPLVARVRNVTESGFEVAVFGEEGGDASTYTDEDVGWLAVSGATEDGELSWAGEPRPMAVEQIGLSDEPKAVGDTFLHLQEERSATDEVEHDEELVDVLHLEGAVFGQDVSFRDDDPAVVRRTQVDGDDE